MKFCPLLIACCILLSCEKQTAVTAAATDNHLQEQPVQTIQFSGLTWNVKHSPSIRIGPGPNRWDKNDVWVDANGYLHLKIRRDSLTNKWFCAEVSTQQTFGYGTYQFWVEGRIDQFDKNTVLGLFNYSGNDGYDEMDIEFARWGNKRYPNLNYTIWPAQQGFNNFSYTKEFTLSGSYTTQRFKRTATSVKLQSLGGFYNDNTNEFATATCTNPPNAVSTLAMPVYINLWLFQGKAPSDKKEVEIIIHQFTFTP